ncbi:MAG: DUF1566 domain-containing protein [Betaproteobacteria bacterium]|nr:DUF1566 domain-containing protein [Betaproteobacteria bacterium]
MINSPRSLPLAFFLAAAPVHAAGLPDSGQDICYGDTAADVVAASSAASIARDAGTHPRQDCRYGPDPAVAAGAVTRIGSGAKGFDYTKIANNGAALAATATLGTAANDWACTRDNITGLTWEVKTAGSTDLRYAGHEYTWYSNDTATNGGGAGSTGDSSCNAAMRGSPCNTQAFAAAVNAAALCAYTDWRMPTRRELRTLHLADGSNPQIDLVYFPNTHLAEGFWSGSTYAAIPQAAWFVDFSGGYSSGNGKDDTGFTVRLVRGAPF